MKIKKIMIICIFLLAILTLTTVSATEDNSTDSNMQSASENMDLTSEIELDEVNDGKLSQSIDENQAISDQPNPLNVNFPSKFEVRGSSDVLEIVISLPKKSNGLVSIYEDGSCIQTFNLQDKRFSSEVISEECEIGYTSDTTNDNYYVQYYMKNPKIALKNFTVRYDNGVDVFEKSAMINFTYVLGCENRLLYTKDILEIDAPFNAHGKVAVEIDGRQYETYSKNYFYGKTKTTSHYCKIKPKLAPGVHNVRITYLGDSIYPSHTVECELLIYAEIKTYDWFYYHEKISLQLPSNAKGSLMIQLYDSNKKLVKTYSKKLVKGKASLAIPKNVYGKFSKVVAKYSGNDYSVRNVVYRNVVITPVIKAPKTMLKGEKKYVSINLPGKKGVLKVYMELFRKGKYKNKVYTVKLVKGKAKFSLSKFRAGDTLYKIKFVETLKKGKKVSYTQYRSCSILKPLNIYYTTSEYGHADAYINAYKAGGKPLAYKFIKIKINGKFVKKVKTNKYGEAEFKIPKKYKPNTYRLTAQYKKNIESKKIKIIK